MKFECEKLVVEIVYENGRRIKRIHVKDPSKTPLIPCEKHCEVCIVEPSAFDLAFMGW